MRKFRFLTSTVGLSFFMSGIASAAVFPDVPDGHMYQQPIENLVSSGVLTGNPDGTFSPDKSVNRAEMLAILYRAAGKTPDASSIKCFPDVVPGSWYEMYVCDAAANGFVNGYPNGTFGPGKPVLRVEALKMITNILGIEVDEIDINARESVKFVDVSVSAWYTKYLYAAYTTGILPIAGISTSRFYPDAELLKGEAAAMVYNAIVVELNMGRSSASSASSSSSTTSSAAEETTNSSTSSVASSVASETSIAISFPFNTSGKFNDKKSYSYTFTLDEAKTGYIETEVSTGAVSCRLYLLKESGFSDEYYLGKQEGKYCYLHVAMRPGDYQLQLQPTVANATFTVEAEQRTGDGNDGFIQAMRLLPLTARSAELAVNDIVDYYMFTVTSEQNMTLQTTNALEVKCVIYPMSDVDLFGFTSPECNKNYLFPTGTYYVAISRSIASKTTRKSYTLTLR